MKAEPGSEESSPTDRRAAGWWIAALTVLFAVAALAVLFRPLRQNHLPNKTGVPTPKIDVATLDDEKGNMLLREQANLFDPTPLFLPTRWNASQRPLPADVQRQPGQVFDPFPAKLVFSRDELNLPVASAQDLPKSPMELLKEPPRNPFIGFDRRDLPLTPVPARFGVVEVHRLNDAKDRMVFPLLQAVVLPVGRLDWQPAEFVVTVTVSGLLGRPANTVSSNVEEVDSFLGNYLVNTLHLGQRLAPGVYRVVVGP